MRDSLIDLQRISSEMEKTDLRNRRLLFDYPVVYIHHASFSDKYDVYIGESNDIIQRTQQHYEKARIDGTWQNKVMNNPSAQLFIIGHPHFNKSLTLDIENKLMNYMLSVDSVERIHNLRGNEQYSYYPSDELNDIFASIWSRLNRVNKNLFPDKDIVEKAALFKASPFHKLSQEQKNDKERILQIIHDALSNDITGQLVIVQGEAGTGKTVLNSNIFYELCSEMDDLGNPKYNLWLLVNHEQQLKVYQQIVQKLGLISKESDFVSKPTSFINRHRGEEPVDIIFVDEAHLLWTQGKQAYQGDNQLDDLRKMAKVVVAMFDPKQVLHTQEYIEPSKLTDYLYEAKEKNHYLVLENQLRIHGSRRTVKWIRDFIDRQIITEIPEDTLYDLRIMNSPEEMEKEISSKATLDNTKLSRILATFDWEYIEKKKPEGKKYWMGKVGDWERPWNLQLPKKRNSNKLPWAEQEQTID